MPHRPNRYDAGRRAAWVPHTNAPTERHCSLADLFARATRGASYGCVSRQKLETLAGSCRRQIAQRLRKLPR